MALSKLTTAYKKILVVLLVAIGAASLAWGFAQLPLENSGIAIDWKQIWGATHGFQANYVGTELRTPPWAVPLLWPLTIFPFEASLGLAAFATIATLVLSIPRRANKLLWASTVFAAVTAYPAMRQLIDGNVEALVIGGALLVLWGIKKQHSFGLALGLLMAAAKIQVSWLLLVLSGLWMLQHWPKSSLAKALGWTVLMAAPMLVWKGAEWWNGIINFPWAGTLIDSSLRATLVRLGASNTMSLWLWISLAGLTAWLLFSRRFDPGRIQFGWLTSASLLLSPYAASNSVLTPLALGVMPMLHDKPTLGLGLLALYNLPYLFLPRPEIRFAWESSYWTLILLITWATLAYSQFGPLTLNRTEVKG